MRRAARPLLAMALVGGAALAILQLEAGDPERIESAILGLGLWAPLAFFAVYVLAMVLLGSAALLCLAGGALFGPVWGTALNAAALFAGAVAGFYIGRYLAGDFVRRRARGRFKQILDGVEHEGWRFVTFVRLVPVFHHASVSYALGATRIRFRAFAIPTAICGLPGAFAFAWLGHVGREAASGAEGLVAEALVALGLIATLAFVPRVMMRWRRRHGIAYADVVEIRRAGEPMEVLLVDDDGVPPAAGSVESVGRDALGGWMESNRQRWRTPFVVAAENEGLARRAARRMRESGFADVRYLFGGAGALSDRPPADGREGGAPAARGAPPDRSRGRGDG